MSLREELLKQGRAAKEAAQVLANLSTDVKDKVLEAIAGKLVNSKREIMEENNKDLKAGEAAGLSKALLDRLTLNESRIEAMAEGLRELARLPDPVGEIMEMPRRPNGLQVGKMRVPLGVVGMIYEARPNVTIDAAGLCFKAGNAVILRGIRSCPFKQNFGAGCSRCPSGVWAASRLYPIGFQDRPGGSFNSARHA